MPIETLVVDGKQYLYFYYYDSATKQKRRVYCGPKGSSESLEKANRFESRYEQAQEQKKRVTGTIGKLSALAGEIAGYSSEERALVLTCLVEAYPDLQWVVNDQMALFGWLNEDKSLLRRLSHVYGMLKADAARIQEVSGDLRMLIGYLDSDWYSRVRYRNADAGDDKPERDPSLKHHVNDNPENVVVEILRGWLDAYDHAQKRLDALLETARSKNLDAIIEAIELIGITKAMADSREVIREVLDLV